MIVEREREKEGDSLATKGEQFNGHAAYQSLLLTVMTFVCV